MLDEEDAIGLLIDAASLELDDRFEFALQRAADDADLGRVADSAGGSPQTSLAGSSSGSRSTSGSPLVVIADTTGSTQRFRTQNTSDFVRSGG